jgi:hypothetical protein
VIPGPSLRVLRRLPGTARRLYKTRTLMRFVSAHCTTSALIPPHRRPKPLQTLGSLRRALQFWLKSKLLPSRTPRRRRPLRQRRQSHLLRVQHRRRHLQLRQLRRCALLLHPGRIRYQGNAQHRIRAREGGGDTSAINFARSALGVRCVPASLSTRAPRKSGARTRTHSESPAVAGPNDNGALGSRCIARLSATEKS